ncbi:retrovirus-related Pol polyprotein from type-1 retrotransposable element R2 [Caerostris darwini]|uniref:Retrovirus-related Pol polyprotein from type-1 retrotransposable element R2 n=1 Tax=Caerostris darwini TaxID=1538125 RepID=A0AAV4SDD5_9ARAC|nr:retrovirus-related Pol polyprotein from type-1 retrotransposable element R2 [Caerostris darwini]
MIKLNSIDDTEQALNTFTNTILNALDKSSKPNFNHQRKRIPPDIRNLIKNRNKIRRAWQISKDPALKTAKNKIHDIIKRKMKKLNDANWSNITKDLSSNSNSLWRKVADLQNTAFVEWAFEDQVPRLLFQDLILKPQHRRRVLFSIRDRLRVERSLRLKNKNNQGKVLKLASLAPASSHFVSDGSYTRFADWRFIHKARLNLLPLNGCQQWKSANDKMCRRCSQWAETLPHVINHCGMHSHGWQLRHNAIVDRLVQAMQRKTTILSLNQNVCETTLRPDITARMGNTVFIVDVTCPFEGNDTAFSAAYESKVSKYEPLIPLYQAQGLTAVIVIVGALGSWCPWNDKFLKKFCSNSYISLFRKLCVSDNIKWSRDIYTEHITGHRQYLLEDNPSPAGHRQNLSETSPPPTSHSPNENIPSSIV